MQTSRIFGTAAFALAMASAPAAAHENHEVNLGVLGVSTNIDAKELGLPVYPGAKPHKKDHDEDSSARVWAGLGSFGFKVVVVELDAPDAPEKVAAFYRLLLGRFGTVLDCGAAKPASIDDDMLNCKNDHVKPGEFLFKAGRKHEMHVVGVEREGTGSKIALVYIDLRGVGD